MLLRSDMDSARLFAYRIAFAVPFVGMAIGLTYGSLNNHHGSTWNYVVYHFPYILCCLFFLKLYITTYFTKKFNFLRKAYFLTILISWLVFNSVN